jgi:alanine racemase
VARRAVAQVALGAIERNCARLARAAAPATLCAVVKADGYGHGAVPAAWAALAGGAEWLAVATSREALELRAAGIDRRLLIMGALSDEELPEALEAQGDVVAWDPGWAAALPPATRVHVKLDTGMGRLGTRSREQADATVEAAAEAGCEVAGAMTHFATADEDAGFVAEQLREFLPWADRVCGRHPMALRHAANSAAVLGHPAAHLDLVRCGIAVYGLDPFHSDPRRHELEPALRLTSWVAAVKECAPGQSAGYGRRFVAREPTRLATLPIGYGDGVRRGLTNNADVVIGGRRFPLVGTVSMDNITIDVGDADVGVGDEAVLIGDGILAEEMARRLDTINYEVTTGISRRVPRMYG